MHGLPETLDYGQRSLSWADFQRIKPSSRKKGINTRRRPLKRNFDQFKKIKSKLNRGVEKVIINNSSTFLLISKANVLQVSAIPFLLVRIRLRIRSSDLYLRLRNPAPDPVFFVTFKTPTKIFFFLILFAYSYCTVHIFLIILTNTLFQCRLLFCFSWNFL
jgi:hypothetical protein